MTRSARTGTRCPPATQALDRSRRTGLPALTSPFDFLVGGEGRGFVLYLPTTQPTAGWVAAPFNGDTFMTEVLGREVEDVRITLSDVDMPRAERMIASQGIADDRAPRVSRQLEAHGRRWVVDVAAGKGFESPLAAFVPQVGGLFSVVATLVVALFAALQADRRHRAEQLAQQAESELEDRDEDYRLLAENATDLITRHDVDGVVLYASPAAAHGLGLRPEDLVGRLLCDLAREEDCEAHQQVFAHSGQQSGSHGVRWRLVECRDGCRWLETLVRGVHDEHGALVEFHATTRDVTEQVTAEQTVRRSQARQQAVLDGLEEGVVLTDADGTLANPAAARLLGRGPGWPAAARRPRRRAPSTPTGRRSTRRCGRRHRPPAPASRLRDRGSSDSRRPAASGAGCRSPRRRCRGPRVASSPPSST